jgi:hypothetical protein
MTTDLARSRHGLHHQEEATHGAIVAPTDDEDFEVLEARAHEAARKQWERALSSGVDVDEFITQSRSNHLAAKERGHRHIARFWGTLADDLAERLRAKDEVECASMEDIGLVDGIWPDGYDQALDWTELDPDDGPDLDM